MSHHDGKLCVNCCYWDDGLCHYEPPSAVSDWPRTKDTDWCGKWSPEAPNRRLEREAGTLKDLA